MSAARTRLYLSLLFVAALAARIVPVFVDPGPMHPDEFFQYIEPAWWHLTGTGTATWEWQEGLRSWVLPFYNGAWLAGLMRLGVRKGPALGRALQVHWAIVNALLVPLAYRAGAQVSRALVRHAPRDEREVPGAIGGLCAASACAAFPPLVLYAGHTLSEMPSMLCLLWGLVCTAELCERDERGLRAAALAGFVISLGVCLRVANAPLSLLPPLWLLVTRRFRELGVMIAASLVPALCFALVDLFTWGSFAGSYVKYIEFNVIQGKATRFGSAPPLWYVERLRETVPYVWPALVVLALAGIRGSWPYLVSALLMLGVMSTQAHKEARFLIGLWPLFLIAAFAVLGALVARARTARLRLGAIGLATLGLFAVCGVALRDAHRDHWPPPGRMIGLAWAGAQRDVTGMIVDDTVFAASSVWFGKTAPLNDYNRSLLENPLFSHALLMADSAEERAARAAGFVRVFFAGDGHWVLRR